MAKQKPVKTIRIGRGVNATIWENQGENGSFYNVMLARTYRDKNGRLQDTASFTVLDLPYVEKAAAAAFSYLWKQPVDAAEDETERE